MRVINLIVVHCSATKADRDFTEQDLEVCHRRRGMNGPGYHFYIRKNGDIKTTRPIEKIGAHARGYNAQSIGICYEGGESASGAGRRIRGRCGRNIHCVYWSGRCWWIIPVARFAVIGI